MISIKIPDTVIQQFAKTLGDDVTKRVRNMLKEHKAEKIRLTRCELQFYKEIETDAASFLAMAPSAIERKFRKMNAAVPSYVVLASGSLPTIARHIEPAKRRHYQRLWNKHKYGGKKAGCNCLFCEVSSRADRIFNWPAFLKKDQKSIPPDSMAGKFVKSVGLTICPYCSRNHIAPLTEATGTVYSPDLDHFFAQSIYPYFRLCLQNLVPSCSACNCRIKGATDFLRNGYLHPYEHDAPEQLFVLEGTGVKNGQRIDPANTVLRLQTGISARAKKSAEFFHLPLAYESHLVQACQFADSLRFIPTSALEERARILQVDTSYLMLILNRPADPMDDSYKHRVLGRLMRDMQSMFQKP